MAVETVHAQFQASVAAAPAAPFLLTEPITAAAYGLDAGTRSYGDAAREVERLRSAYADAGWGHGHRVGLLLENRPAFLLHWYALNALGASVVPIDAALRSTDLAYLIAHSGIGLAVCLPERARDLHDAATSAGVPFATVDASLASPPRARAVAPLAGEPIGIASECALLYTSGTTGRPKGCRLDNGYFLRAGRWYATLDDLATVRPAQERIATPLPLTHVNAMAFSSMAAISSGNCLVQMDRFHPSTWWRSVRDSGATIVHYLGVMPAMLLKAEASPADRDHAVRWGFGAGVGRGDHAAFEERFGFPLIEAWAMTETGAAACVMANREPRHVGTSCFGRAPSTMELRLVGDDGRDVAEGEPGELLVRGAGDEPRRDFFREYLKDAAATDEAWAGGWFHTGDVVRRGPDGSLHFVDRRKNVIRRSGENISAVEVEGVLNRHPAVRASAVAATPDELRGDEVLACIVTHEPPTVDARDALARELTSFALERLAYWKAPGWVAFVEALPLTTSQKIQRGQLRELARSLPGQPHCIDTRWLKKRPAT